MDMDMVTEGFCASTGILQNNHCECLANKGTDSALLQLLSLLEDLKEINEVADDMRLHLSHGTPSRRSTREATSNTRRGGAWAYQKG
jgi:hypothetical protein